MSLVTDEKAITEKWCPLMRVKCVGSACMLWRWAEPLTDGPDSYLAEPGPLGFCGLAGKPEE